MADRAETVVQSQEEAVRAKMLSLDEPKIEIVKPENIEGFTFPLPEKASFDQKLRNKYPNLPELQELQLTTNILFNYLDTSLIKYPQKPEGITLTDHIEKVDEQILDNFEGEDSKIAHRITLNNRLRANYLFYIQSSLENAVIILDGVEISEELNNILGKIKGLVDTDAYKEGKSYEEKMEIARKYSKAAEMSIRLLDGDELVKEDFDSLDTLNIE